jgi:hypothetical protein
MLYHLTIFRIADYQKKTVFFSYYIIVRTSGRKLASLFSKVVFTILKKIDQ